MSDRESANQTEDEEDTELDCFEQSAHASYLLLLMKVDLMIAANDTDKFELLYSVNIELFLRIEKTFDEYLLKLQERIALDVNHQDSPSERLRNSYEMFQRLTTTPRRSTRSPYTTRIALLLYFSFCNGTFTSVSFAESGGFEDADEVRKSTAELLKEALKMFHPISITTETRDIVALEGAMNKINGFTNCIYIHDTEVFLPFLKLDVIYTALNTIEDYSIQPVSISDEESLKNTKIGKALISGSHVEELNWPPKFKWRQYDDMPEGLQGVEECTGYLMSTSRKYKFKSNQIVCPFFNAKKKVDADDEMIASNMSLIGFKNVDRFLKEWLEHSYALRTTNCETDPSYTINIIEIALHTWNITHHLDYINYQKLPKEEQTSNAYLSHYYEVEHASRISEDVSAPNEATEKLLLNYLMNFAPKDIETTTLNKKIRNVCEEKGSEDEDDSEYDMEEESVDGMASESDDD